jgi:hypothetical protein
MGALLGPEIIQGGNMRFFFTYKAGKSPNEHYIGDVS